MVIFPTFRDTSLYTLLIGEKLNHIASSGCVSKLDKYGLHSAASASSKSGILTLAKREYL